ncbi:unnamed protein product [Brachionus calyciflorus]|uniref:Reverse transcriptase domain-containing protein n=1 Tax=Brachionus calyciflorus TaxID=104777 RepID=A0A813M5Z1_9BILA|nr:unnamed protein product [Brachionus calyciflorus]
MSHRHSTVGGVGGGSRERTLNAQNSNLNIKTNSKNRDNSNKKEKLIQSSTPNNPQTNSPASKRKASFSPKSSQNASYTMSAKVSRPDPSIRFVLNSSQSDNSQNFDEHVADTNISMCSRQQPESNKTHELDAVKLRISKAVINEFSNPYSLLKEIRRCVVLIATDDTKTHNILSQDWPPTAFQKGVFVLKKRLNQDLIQNKKQLTLIIKKVHSDIDLDSWESISDLENLGLRNAKRILNRKKEKTELITVEAISQEAFENALKNGVCFGATRHRFVEPQINFVQCHKCQGFGHRQFDCNESQKCAKCSGGHHFKECTSDAIKCCHCGKSHWSFSRKCEFVRNATNDQIYQFLHKKDQHDCYAYKASQNLNNPQVNEASLTKLITKITTTIIEDQLKLLANKVMDVFIYAISQTLTSFESHESPVINLLKKTLEENLMSKSKKEIASLAKDYSNQINQSEQVQSKARNQTQKKWINLQLETSKLYDLIVNLEIGGVSICIKNSIKFERIDLDLNEEIIAVKILSSQIDPALNNDFILVTFYNPPNSVICAEILSKLAKLGQKVLIMGDLNAHSPTWKSKRYNTSGKIVEEFLIEEGFILLNQDEPTYQPIHRPDYNAIIDLALPSTDMMDLVKSFFTSDFICSDHVPILVDITNSDFKPTKYWKEIKKIDYSLLKKTSLLKAHTLRSNTETLQEGLAAFNRNKKLGAIFIDIEKAFDKVWHSGLLFKLDKMRIPDILGKWLKNYLYKRCFMVRVGGFLSTKKLIENGVPQGSVLGPLLFNLFFNDITEVDSQIDKALFADDISAWSTSNLTSVIKLRLQRFLNSIYSWMFKWRLKISTIKTLSCVFNKAFLNYELGLTYYGEPISSERNPKFLGITLDPGLRLHKYAENLRQRSVKRLNMLRSIGGLKWGVSPATKIVTYKTLIRSLIDYAPFTPLIMYEANRQILERIQLKALRHSYNLPQNSTAKEVYDRAKMEKVFERSEMLSINYLIKAKLTNSLISSLIDSYIKHEELDEGILCKNNPRKTILGVLKEVANKNSKSIHFSGHYNHINSQRGSHPIAIHKNYLYWFKEKNKDQSIRCSCSNTQRLKCNASTKIRDNEVIKRTGHHFCERLSDSQVKSYCAQQELKNKVQKETNTIFAFYQETQAKLVSENISNDPIAANFPSFKKIATQDDEDKKEDHFNYVKSTLDFEPINKMFAERNQERLEMEQAIASRVAVITENEIEEVYKLWEQERKSNPKSKRKYERITKEEIDKANLRIKKRIR